MRRAFLALALAGLLSSAWADGVSGPGLPSIGGVPGLKFAPAASGAGCSQSATFLARTSGLTGTQTSAYQTLICGMVTDGTWSLMDYLGVYATNTTTTANLNLISASYGLTTHGTETFSANNGYTGDGSTGYFDTGFNPTTAATPNFALDTGTIGVCVLTSRTTSHAYSDIGDNPSVGQLSYIQPLNTTVLYGINDTGNSTTSPTGNAQGAWFAVRTVYYQVTAYHNATSLGAVSNNDSSIANQNFYIGADNGVSGAENFSADQLAYAFIGSLSNPTQITNVQSRLATFLTAVGAPSGC